MARCDQYGNDYDKSFEVGMGGLPIGPRDWWHPASCQPGTASDLQLFIDPAPEVESSRLRRAPTHAAQVPERETVRGGRTRCPRH